MKPFGFLIAETASRQLLELPLEQQWQALRAVEILAEHPFTTGLPHWEGDDGRRNHLRRINDWSITFSIDHADRNVRILEIEFC